MLAADIFDGAAYLMDDAMQYHGIRKYALGGIQKAFETIDTSYEDVVYITVLLVSYDNLLLCIFNHKQSLYS